MKTQLPQTSHAVQAAHQLPQATTVVAAGFVDVRAQALAQRRVQAMADNSPQARQSQAMQALADHSPQTRQLKALNHVMQPKQGRLKPSFQMKAAAPVAAGAVDVMQLKLDAEKLNIAGEDHSESDKAGERGKEKAFTKAKTGVADYWTEYEFQVDTDAGAGRTVKKPADPPLTVVLYLLSVTRKRLAELKTYIDTNDASAGYYMGWRVWSKSLIQGIETLNSHIERCVDSEGLPNSDPVKVCVASTTQLLAAIKPAPTAAEMAPYAVLAAKYETAAALLAPTLGGTGDYAEDEKSSNTKRNNAMHAAGNKMFTTKGVWKIGNAHVEEIEEAKMPEYKYNLVSRTDFRSELKAYQDEEKKKNESCVIG
ncbi:hypothetical protein [Undibacterium sp. TJN19]|uniref:hypothetical protein n=1 Tax=Undibacterium sp. TJN19 TaxID=3413055 RepID=UPI003BF277CE